VSEQVIADIGESIAPSETDLLNTLEACRRLPEPRGAIAAGDTIVLKQLERIDGYIKEALPVVNSNKVTTQGFISEGEIQRLVARCREARQAFALLQRRPALLNRLPPDRLTHVSTVSIVLGFHLGWNHLKWQEAAELAAGVLPTHIATKLDSRT